MEHVLTQAHGWLLALSALLFGVAHSIVVAMPAHPDFQLLRTIVRGRELVLVPLSLLLLSVPGLLGTYQLSVLGMVTSISLLLTFFLLMIAPQLRKEMHKKVQTVNHTYQATQQVQESDPPKLKLVTDSSPSGGLDASEASLGPALTELRSQRRMQQVLWDLPVAVILLDMDLCVQSRVGGLTRASWFPCEMSETGMILEDLSVYKKAALTVLRSQHRDCFEADEGGQHIQVCATPWVSMSGKLKGVAFMITAFHDRMLTDESEVRYHA